MVGGADLLQVEMRNVCNERIESQMKGPALVPVLHLLLVEESISVSIGDLGVGTDAHLVTIGQSVGILVSVLVTGLRRRALGRTPSEEACRDQWQEHGWKPPPRCRSRCAVSQVQF